MNETVSKKPSLFYALKLKCPYCGLTPLLKKKSWLSFREACGHCRYNFEREEGYFTGASWMINFPTTAVITFIIGAFILANGSFSADMVALIVSIFALLIGFGLTPYSMAVWIVIEHRISPLNKDDSDLSVEE